MGPIGSLPAWLTKKYTHLAFKTKKELNVSKHPTDHQNLKGAHPPQKNPALFSRK